MKYKKLAQLKTIDSFREYLNDLNIKLPLDTDVESGIHSPLSRKIKLKDGFTIGNRFCTQPMEGWDGTPEGKPTEFTKRRWRNFGKSGAKLIWGGEAVAVSHEGRGNPNQLLLSEENLSSLEKLRKELLITHNFHHGSDEDLLIGLQLTHSGRFSKPDPDNQLKPKILYHHPYLDKKFGINEDYPLLSDQQIKQIIEDFIDGALLAKGAGFQFVDIKHCHGYLGHEFLSSYSRSGPFGGSFLNRTRFLREIVSGIRSKSPGFRIAVRVSIYDFPPYTQDEQTGVGKPINVNKKDKYWFGVDSSNPFKIDLTEPIKFLKLLQSLGIELVNITAGSPYYVPHIQRPALFPPSDGYRPPEDPLVGVARLITTTAKLKSQFPEMILVGSAFSYLQEWLPHVAQRIIRDQKADFVGLGRLILPYPEFPSDILSGRPLSRKKLCRTFSDCTTAPRNGLISGCYPLDEFYRGRNEAEKLAQIKKEMRE